MVGTRRLILGYLAFGAAATIAVAWACPMCWRMAEWSMDLTAMGDESHANAVSRNDVITWPRGTPADWPAPKYAYESRAMGVTVSAVLDYYPGCKTGWGHAVGNASGGWPCRLSWALVQDDVPPAGIVYNSPTWYLIRPWGFLPDGSSWRSGVAAPLNLPSNKGEWVRLPLRPVVLGFAADVLVYSCAGWCLLTAPGMIRGRLRSRRGECVGCGYQLAGFTGCPECGRSAAITERGEAGGA